MSMQGSVFTIGHSTHPQERFIALLCQHGIMALCDVRSKPYSRLNPQFNRRELEQALPAHGIAYRFLGRELGGRSDDPACYEGGQVQYDRLAKTGLFRHGLKRVLRGMNEDFRIVLMCAEKEPLECHRTILVARHLAALGIGVEHIHPDGRLESHDAALSRLARMLNSRERDMFHSREELLADAYHQQEERIAYGRSRRCERRHSQGRGWVKIFTIGFTKKPAETFFTRLKNAGVKRLIDVRLNNVSQLAGFTKKDDLRYFTKAICSIDYIHLPELAPTTDILDAYKKAKNGDWQLYERQFIDLIRSRHVENTAREIFDGGCLLCSEEKPHHCHRRLIAEYLKEHWRDVEIEHIL